MLSPFYDLGPTSKVWIFQGTKEFTLEQSREIKAILYDFLKEWTAHKAELHTAGDVLFQRFIVIMVDESLHSASGCSIDTMTHFIQDLEQKYANPLFDRMTIVYENDKTGLLNTVHLNEVKESVSTGKITEDTFVFNNLVKSKAEFESGWKCKIKDSWHKRFI